ncbi:MAG: hypothetical protein LBK98_03405 [Peptococcaceae bacterium]|jgi:hypothetical protein|nr:hypothetical protein [Peptococcaceae bacterium]
MKQTLRGILGEQPPAATLYGGLPADLLDYAFNLPPLFTLCPAREMIGEYSYHEDLETIFRGYRRAPGQPDPPPLPPEPKSFDSYEEKVAYRARKAWLGEERRLAREQNTLRAYRQVFGEENPLAVRYKDVFALTDPGDLARKLPALKGWRGGFAAGLPLFTRYFNEFCQVIRAGGPIAIEGGPCLFGADEVIVRVETAGGARDFDFIGGFNYDSYGQNGNPLLDYLSQNAGAARELRFISKKRALTTDEFEHLNTQFSLAERLGCPMVVTVPDMAYIKYLDSLLPYLDAKTGEAARQRFRAEAHRIADLYLAAIGALRQTYRVRELAVLHERDQGLLDLFYEKRHPFEDSKVVRAREDKLASVLDYVTMPAMPYYLWGIGNILEFNSLLEAESLIKCGRLHKSAFQLHALLFPHRVSRDGEHTAYFAGQPYKDYRDGAGWAAEAVEAPEGHEGSMRGAGGCDDSN